MVVRVFEVNFGIFFLTKKNEILYQEATTDRGKSFGEHPSF